MIERFRKNINYNRYYMSLKIDFTQGFWMIYLAGKGMSLIQLGLLETLFHVTSLAMEMPTGIIADLYGRKGSRIAGRILFIGAVSALLAGQTFWSFAVGFVLFALSYNLESGSGEALVYDSLKAIGETRQYLRITGQNEGIYQATSLFAFLVGGVVASVDYRGIFWLSIVFAALSLLPAFRWAEPPRGDADAHPDFLGLLKESLGLLRTKRRIGFFVLIMEFLLSLGTVLFFYLQNFWKLQGFNERWIGFFFALSALLGILGGISANRIERRIGEKRFLLWFPSITVACIWVIALTPWHVPAYMVITFVDSLLFVGLNAFINREIESHVRATVLSMASMAFSVYMILLFPMFGWVAEHAGFTTGFLALGGLAVLVWGSGLPFILKRLE